MCHEDDRSCRGLPALIFAAQIWFILYFTFVSLLFKHKKVLTADPVAVGIRIVTPAEDAGVRNIIWEEIAVPVDAVRSRPCLVSMPVQAMDGDDADNVREQCKTENWLYSTTGSTPSATILRP